MKKIFFISVISITTLSCQDIVNNHVKEEMNKIDHMVAQDAIEQYNIAKKNGSVMDAYTQACFVAAAFLQAKDSVNYKKWKAIEKEEGKLAGLPDDLLE